MRVRVHRHAPAALPPENRSRIHYTGGWMGPRASLDRCEKSHFPGIQSPERPARSHGCDSNPFIEGNLSSSSSSSSSSGGGGGGGSSNSSTIF
jgi:hypothetical protein